MLMTGNIINADEIETTKKTIDNTVDTINSNISVIRRNNENLLRSRTLELFQLEEQGDQVVKSPWESWQFGLSLSYDNMDHIKGNGDKSFRYGYEGIFVRSDDPSVRGLNPNFPAYNRYLSITPISGKYPINTATTAERNSNRNIVGSGNLSGGSSLWSGILNTNTPVISPVKYDISIGLEFITITRNPLSLTAPPIPSGTGPTIPQIILPKFSPATPDVKIASPKNPPAIDQVSSGFGQSEEKGWLPKDRNVALGNVEQATADTNTNGTTVIFKDKSLEVPEGFSFKLYGSPVVYVAPGVNVVDDPHKPSSVADPKLQHSFQTFLNVLSNSSTLNGVWNFRNETLDPFRVSTANSAITSLRDTNSVRFVSINHAYENYDKKAVFTLTGDLNIYGRSNLIPSTSTSSYAGKNHMTIGIEHQAFSSLAAEAINNGVIRFKTGNYVIGMTAMIEDYNDELFVTSGYYKPWESTMINNGSIIIEQPVQESVGMDFAEFRFNKDSIAQKSGSSPHYNNKGSLNIYAKPGNIELNGNGSIGSYALRIPNVFKEGVDPNAIYYDETIINGEKSAAGGISVKGENNVGVSVSKIISMFRTNGLTDDTKQTTKVYDYQISKTTENINSTGRTVDDLIGNIYNLNILVNGNNNVGFLRNSDYMNGTYSTETLTRSTKDFVLKVANDGTGHIETIDFKNTATGGTLIRTDKYGIDLGLGSTLNITGMLDNIYGVLTPTHANSNVVMLSNGTLGGTTRTAVRNLGTINLGLTPKTGNGLVGLMSYNGALAHNGGSILVNTNNSIGIVSMGANSTLTPATISSEATNTGDITVKGDKSVGVANYGTYTQTSGIVDVSGIDSIGIYAKNSTSTTNIQNSIVNAKDGAVAFYADGTTDALGNPIDTSTINLNNVTSNIGNTGLLFYNYTGTGSGQVGKFNIVGPMTANIGSGGVAFYNRGGVTSQNTFLNMLTGNLTLNMSSGSRLFVFDDPGMIQNLSTVPTAGSATSITNALTNGTVNISGANYKYTTANRATLNVDKNVNLDLSTDSYYALDFFSSNVNVGTPSSSIMTNNGNIIANGFQYAIAQKNSTTNASDVNINIASTGEIKLTKETGLIGVVTDRGTIVNNGRVESSGQDGVGLLGANGSVVTNNKDIIIGNGGAGMMGINNLPLETAGDINITNNGNISYAPTSTTLKSAYGIVAKNTLFHISSVTLSSGSMIDLTNNIGGVGVYASNTSIIDNGGNIKIGENGIGMELIDPVSTTIGSTIGLISSSSSNTTGLYIKSNTATLTTSKNIDLSGDKSVGVYLEDSLGSMSYTNTGNIKIGDSLLQNNPGVGIYTDAQ